MIRTDTLLTASGVNRKGFEVSYEELAAARSSIALPDGIRQATYDPVLDRVIVHRELGNGAVTQEESKDEAFKVALKAIHEDGLLQGDVETERAKPPPPLPPPPPFVPSVQDVIKRALADKAVLSKAEYDAAEAALIAENG